MEPLPQEFRDRLKTLHPELTDDDVDEYEALLVQRLEIDPLRERGRLEALDAEAARLVERKMPLLREAWRDVAPQ